MIAIALASALTAAAPSLAAAPSALEAYSVFLNPDFASAPEPGPGPALSTALDRIDQRALPLDGAYSPLAAGRGVTVYVFDGGVLPTHPELEGRVRLGYVAFQQEPGICNAHGTGVAGAIAGATLGVAPQAQIVDIRMIDCAKERGTIQAIVAGAKWAIEDHKKHPGPAIVNWSFITSPTGECVEAVDKAIAELRAAGMAVVVSAGNIDRDSCAIAPTNSPGVISVGAHELRADPQAEGLAFDRRAPNTAWGNCITLYAPGENVRLPSLGAAQAPTVVPWNGTSMAAGYVSGAAALFLERHPSSTPEQVARLLEGAATYKVMADTRVLAPRLLYVGRQPAQPTQTVQPKAARRLSPPS